MLFAANQLVCWGVVHQLPLAYADMDSLLQQLHTLSDEELIQVLCVIAEKLRRNLRPAPNLQPAGARWTTEQGGRGPSSHGALSIFQLTIHPNR